MGKAGPWTTSLYRRLHGGVLVCCATIQNDLLRGMGGAEEAADYATERHMGVALAAVRRMAWSRGVQTSSASSLRARSMRGCSGSAGRCRGRCG